MLRITNITDTQTRVLLFAVPLAWLLAVSLPEVMRDRIFPFDSALIAANGALFQRLFVEFGDFLAAPLDWLWSYYDQYPALSVRRHPPLFGFVAGIIYSVVGVSAVSAKLTVMLFGTVFALGTYFVARRLLGGYLLAACATLLVVATPEIAMHFRSVWLDIPSLASAMWVFYFYLARLEGDNSTRNALGMAGFTALALYTYQPTVVLLSGVFVHLLAREWRTIYKDRSLLIGAGTLVVMMLPLAAFTLYFAKDNLLITTGEIPEEWQEFASPTYAEWMVRDKLSLAYWFDYARMIVQSYPVQFAGICLWAALRFFRKPTAAETLMFVCLAVTYLGFSWLLVKGHRYTLYMMIPATLLTAAAVRDALNLLLHKSSKPNRYAASAVVLLSAVLQGTLVAPYASYSYLAGFDEPVLNILNEDPDARILYSGRNDAAFVFYTRSLDERRTANVHRASVQLTHPDALEDYVRSEEIDFIVLEVDNPGYDTLEIIDQFRVAILAHVDNSTDFALRADYQLPFGAYQEEGQVLLHVYGRSR